MFVTVFRLLLLGFPERGGDFRFVIPGALAGSAEVLGEQTSIVFAYFSVGRMWIVRECTSAPPSPVQCGGALSKKKRPLGCSPFLEEDESTDFWLLLVTDKAFASELSSSTSFVSLERKFLPKRKPLSGETSVSANLLHDLSTASRILAHLIWEICSDALPTLHKVHWMSVSTSIAGTLISWSFSRPFFKSCCQADVSGRTHASTAA